MNQCPLCKITFPDEQVFCSECGAKLVPVQQEQKEKEQKKEEQKQEKQDRKDSGTAEVKSSKPPNIVLILLLIVAIIGDVYYYSQTSDYRSMYNDSNFNYWNKVTELEEAKTELEQAENKLAATQDLLERSETELDRYSELSGVYGYGSDNYYANKSVLVLKKSETKNVKIHWNGSGTVTMRSSSSSGIDNEWSREWSNSETDVIVTGRSVGYYTITFTNDQNDDAFAILVIVQS